MPRTPSECGNGISAVSPAMQGGERDTLSGAAALSHEVQLGAVSSDVAERLHQQAAAIPSAASGDVEAGIRMAPESLRDDLVRAVGSTGRVDAADESGQQYVNPPAVRKLAAAAVTGQLRVSEFVKESRQLLGAAAPAKESQDEIREAWRMMHAGLAKLDARVGATSTSTHIGPRCLTAWLRRVTDNWETQCVRFRQLSGGRPSLTDCAQRHDAYLITRTQAAALRAERCPEARVPRRKGVS
ncbi:MAG: hypothetical protein SGPRY_007422 [Prymnesium sp.]